MGSTAAAAQTLVRGSMRRVFGWTVRRLLGRLHHIQHRRPVELRTVAPSKVLVVAPHMDDEVIGPGGTVALHCRAGSKVTVVFCAAGATPEADATRTSEARACAELVGFSDLRWLGLPEGALSPREHVLASKLSSILDELRPDIIFVPYPTDHHRDHMAVAVATSEAIEKSGFSGEVWCFEVWSPLWPNVAIDISAVAGLKRAAIACHASQVAGLHYVDGALGLNRYRALRVYVDFAEAFWVATGREFVELTRELARILIAHHADLRPTIRT